MTIGSGISGGGVSGGCLVLLKVVCASLLPQSYIPLSTTGVVSLISTPFLAFGLIVYVIVLFIGGYGMYILLFKKKH